MVLRSMRYVKTGACFLRVALSVKGLRARWTETLNL
jgi:hypothetical protein